MKTLTRRKMLGYIAGSCAAPLWPGLPALAGEHAAVLRTAGRLFANRASRESAALIGTGYLQQHPSESSVPLLCHSLRFLAAPGLATADDTEVARVYARQVSRDFDSGDVVDIQGWMLARTEVRVYALLALA